MGEVTEAKPGKSTVVKVHEGEQGRVAIWIEAANRRIVLIDELPHLRGCEKGRVRQYR